LPSRLAAISGREIPLLSGKYEPTGNAFAARAGLMNKDP
jgi:hypothetical protein